MRPLLFIVTYGLALGACSQSKPPAKTRAEKATPAASVPQKPPIRSVASKQPTPPKPAKPTQASRLQRATRSPFERALGPAIIARLELEKALLAATLGTEAVSKANASALRDKHRICGYPLKGKTKKLGEAQTKALVAALLDKASYLGVTRRCRNTRWFGVRFGSVQVEVVLGRPCDQLIVWWREQGKRKNWGSIVSASMAKRFEALLGETAGK
jgi:hypothetical protein